MPFTIAVRRMPRHVLFEVSGPASLKNYFDLIDEAARVTLAHGDRLAMVDLRGVVGRLSFTDQFFIGDVVGQKLPHLHRLSSLVAGDPTSYNSEKVAVRKGVNLRSFDSEEAALAWLLAAGDGTGTPTSFQENT
jgi:hypothetical protein